MSDLVKKYIISQVANKNLALDEAKNLLLDLDKYEKKERMDIAVIGMSGRFPKSKNLDEFWKNIIEGVNCISDVPKDRIDDILNILKTKSFSELIYGNTFQNEDLTKLFVKSGYLDEIDKFDSQFFNIPPNEAMNMDPCHRKALEVAWEAMEDAGYGGNSLVGSKTGIYFGKEGTNYSFYKCTSNPNPMLLTGTWESLMISRISYLFDFKGPCVMVDTACSAGLVSVHLAVQALQNGECDLALAGGINISLTGELKSGLTKINLDNIENGDGYVKTFDELSKGTVWGEGVGVVLLKPLKQALKDGDHIHAVIKGSAINNDGHSSSMTAPDADAQKQVILDSWKKAGVSPEMITYVEAHGTGTILGDPIEAQGLKNAFSQYTNRKQFCAIGSLKTNMGHMVGASGIASLLKVIMAVENKKIAPMINFNVPNPYIDFVDGPLYVSNVLKEWETGENPRIGALSSFGFSRTNCHMVVEQAPIHEENKEKQKYYCLTISAKDQDLMEEYIRKYCKHVNQKEWSLPDLCYTSNVGRGHYEYRTIIIASTEEELKERLVKASLNKIANEDGIYQGRYQITSDKKDYKENGDITRVEIAKLSKEVAMLLNEYSESDEKDIEVLKNICMAYCKGANIEWSQFYKGESRKRVSAPVYPLRRTRYWAPIKESVFTDSTKILHPLVERKIRTDNNEIKYETVLRLDKHWVLSDHHVNNVAVVPGTTYLEMLRFVLENEMNVSKVQFQNVFFLVPLVVENECKIEIELQPIKNKRGYLFGVNSYLTEGQKVTHVQGEIYSLEDLNEKEMLDIEKYKANANSIMEYTFSPDETEGFYFGPHWDGIRKSWDNKKDSLVELYLLNGLENEVDTYKLHPSMLDNAVNFKSQDRGVYLPFMYKSIKVYGSLTKKIYSHVKVNTNRPFSKETMTYDIDIVDEQGQLLVEIEEYTVKEVKNVSSIGSNIQDRNCLKVSWIPTTMESSKEDKVGSKLAVILTEGNRSKELMNAITQKGCDATAFYVDSKKNIDSSDILSEILKELEDGGYNAIVFAPDYTMDNINYDNLLNEEGLVDKYRNVGVDFLFRLSKGLVESKNKGIKSMHVLVHDAAYVDGSEENYSPFAAATIGMAKVIGEENKKLSVNVLDVSSELVVSDFVSELLGGKGIHAIRKSGTYMQYVQSEYISLEKKWDIDCEGVYVITGGLGGIGLAIAEHIADKSSAKVILVGRRTLANSEQWIELSNEENTEQELYKRLLDLKKKLKHIEYVALDVTDRNAVEQFGLYVKENYSKVNGIFHAAGVAGEGFIFKKEFEQYTKVMSPKVNGTVNLFRLAEAYEDCFVFLFSSITALTGGEGQSDYCAANSFIDTFVELARMNRTNAVSVNWPIWNETGMSKDFAVDKEGGIFTAIEPKEAFEWLEYMICEPERLILPSKVNEEKINEFADILPFKLELSPVKTNTLKKSDAVQVEQHTVKVRGTHNPTKVQCDLVNILGNLLGLNEVDIYNSFADLGGNSLMSTQYLETIEKVYPDIVHISDIFSYPSINELAEYITEQLPDIKEVESAEVANDDTNLGSFIEMLEEELAGTDMMAEFLEELHSK